MESSLVKKLLIKPSYRILLVNAPEGYVELLDPLPQDAKIYDVADGNYDLIQLFSKNSEELSKDLEWLQSHLRKDTVFWISYPKKSSGIETDLGMMLSWDATEKYGLAPVASAAIDTTWTALRFKPKDQINKSQVGNRAIKENEFAEFIDVENRKVLLPPYLETELKKHPEVMSFFDRLAYSHKKEYVLWILSARQEKTRTERIRKMIEKLSEGRKNPSSK